MSEFTKKATVEGLSWGYCSDGLVEDGHRGHVRRVVDHVVFEAEQQQGVRHDDGD